MGLVVVLVGLAGLTQNTLARKGKPGPHRELGQKTPGVVKPHLGPGNRVEKDPCDLAYHPGPGPKLPLLHVLRAVDLEDEQKEAIKTILQGSKEDMKLILTALRDAKMNLEEAILQYDGTEEGDAAIKDAAKLLAENIEAEAILKAGIVYSIKQELTEEQLAELEEILAEMKENPRKFHKKPRFHQFGPRR